MRSNQVIIMAGGIGSRVVYLIFDTFWIYLYLRGCILLLIRN